MSRSGTVLGLDFGKRFIGVAIGEHETRTAHPLTTIDAIDTDTRFAAIAKVVDQWGPTTIVVGKPLTLDGRAHELTRLAERFARQIEGRLRLPVVRVDERLTSVEAVRELRAIGRGGRRDKHLTHSIAARLILQDYFDALPIEEVRA